MGWTSEMVAETYKVSREKQDAYALMSHTRAAKALESGLWADEILPIQIGDRTHSVDDTIRPGTTAEGLAKLKPVFPEWGTASTTAGNASGVGDGAAIAILTTRERAEREGWEIMCKWGGCSVVGEQRLSLFPFWLLTDYMQELSHGIWVFPLCMLYPRFLRS
jgi:acetyl-CoA acetyltransferase